MQKNWELTVLAVDLPVGNLSSMVVGDIDGDGHTEIFVGGKGGLWWLRPETFERGRIDAANFGVGLTLADVDGDGRLELAAARVEPTGEPWMVAWYKQ